MEDIVKKDLLENEELYKKYVLAEERYYKKLGNKYCEVKIDIDIDDKTIKDLFISLAKTEICFDDYIVCLLKEEIVRREMKKL